MKLFSEFVFTNFKSVTRPRNNGLPLQKKIKTIAIVILKDLTPGIQDVIDLMCIASIRCKRTTANAHYTIDKMEKKKIILFCLVRMEINRR